MALSTPLLQNDIQTTANNDIDPLNSHISVGFNTHLLVEMWHAPFSVLANAESISAVLEQADSAIRLNRGEKIRIRVFQFDPYGVSGTATSSAIHILIHTWPERGYAAMDIFAQDYDDAHAALQQIETKLNPGNIHVMELARGQLLELEDT